MQELVFECNAYCFKVKNTPIPQNVGNFLTRKTLVISIVLSLELKTPKMFFSL